MRWFVACVGRNSALVGAKGTKVVWTSASVTWAKGKPLEFVRTNIRRQGGMFYEVAK